MASTASTRYKVEKQAVGENTNTWGDTKLNTGLETLDRGSKGYQAIALTGDTTLSWSNYSASNQGQVSVIKFTGSLTSTAIVTVPATEWQWDAIINAAGASVTVKTSAGTGVTIQNGYQVAAFCDGTNVVYGSPTQIGGNLYAGGQIKNVTAGTASTDAVNKTQMDAAIALSYTATAGADGTIRITSSDTTNKYASTAIVSGAGVTATVLNPASNETLSLSTPQANGVLDATISSGTTALTANGRVKITGGQGDLPTLTAGQFVIVEYDPAAGTTATVGRNSQTIDGAAENDTYTGDGGPSPVVLYRYSSAGAVTSSIIGSVP
jgi:hypothetical protein